MPRHVWGKGNYEYQLVTSVRLQGCVEKYLLVGKRAFALSALVAPMNFNFSPAFPLSRLCAFFFLLNYCLF